MDANPFADARCRAGDVNPAWWDADATRKDVARAATHCAACPAHAACAALARDLGPAASGTWAGVYTPHYDARDVDETLALVLAMFGPPAAATITTVTAHIQLTLDLDLTGQPAMQEAS
jgi:hypothetical protein